MISTGLKEVEHITFVKAVKPRTLPLVGAYATKRLVEQNADILAADFPNVVSGYTQSLTEVVKRLRRNRNVARYIILGETWVGTPQDAYAHIGMLTTAPGEIEGVAETFDGINVAAWLDPSIAGNGYLTRITAELATEGHPDQMLWTVARPSNTAAIRLLNNIGMSSVGKPEQYVIGDNVTAERQLFAATVGDVAQTARVRVASRYPVLQL